MLFISLSLVTSVPDVNSVSFSSLDSRSFKKSIWNSLAAMLYCCAFDASLPLFVNPTPPKNSTDL